MNALLEPEGNVTDISLRNAMTFLNAHGLPDEVEIYQGQLRDTAGEHLVEAQWKDGTQHIFTGFSWGYCGRGPSGLEAFLRMIRCSPPVTIRMIAAWPQEHFPALTYVKGEDYGRTTLPAETADRNARHPQFNSRTPNSGPEAPDEP